MRISKISTGNKLDIKTIGELKSGDTFYLAEKFRDFIIMEAALIGIDMIGDNAIIAFRYKDNTKGTTMHLFCHKKELDNAVINGNDVAYASAKLGLLENALKTITRK